MQTLDVLAEWLSWRGITFSRMDGSTNPIQRELDVRDFNADGFLSCERLRHVYKALNRISRSSLRVPLNVSHLHTSNLLDRTIRWSLPPPERRASAHGVADIIFRMYTGFIIQRSDPPDPGRSA